METIKSLYKYPIAMLVDDNTLDNFINKKVIEGNAFAEKIYINTSGKSALEFLQNINITKDMAGILMPDVIFVDLNMPDMDGFQFIEDFESMIKKTTNTCKIVILTSSINPQDKSRSLGFKNEILFLSKPLMSEKLKFI